MIHVLTYYGALLLLYRYTLCRQQLLWILFYLPTLLRSSVTILHKHALIILTVVMFMCGSVIWIIEVECLIWYEESPLSRGVHDSYGEYAVYVFSLHSWHISSFYMNAMREGIAVSSKIAIHIRTYVVEKKKKQLLYTSKACKSTPSCFHALWFCIKF